jgi:UDP-glucose 4-epimerase
MKIAVTGALGHIGSRLVRALPELIPGLEIWMVDNLATQRFPSLFDLAGTARYRFIEADMTRAENMRVLEGADAVVHLAALTDAAGSFGRADEVERVNLTSTRLVAETCARIGARMIHASSTSVYGTQSATVNEDCAADELKPQSPYAETKLREEDLVRDLCVGHKLRAITFRYGTIFGTSPGMRFHTAVNKFCWQAVMGQPLTVWKTALHQKRPYLDLADCVRAIAFFISSDLFDGRVYNVVTANVTVNDIVEKIRVHVPDVRVELVEHQIMNQLSYEVDNQRLLDLGFDIKGSLDSSIAATIALLRGAASASKNAEMRSPAA